MFSISSEVLLIPTNIDNTPRATQQAASVHVIQVNGPVIQLIMLLGIL